MNVHAGRWSIAWVVVAALVALSAGATADMVGRVLYLRHWFAPMRTAPMTTGEHRVLYGDGPDEADIERLHRVVNTRSGASSRFVQPARRRRSRCRQSELAARSLRGRCQRVPDLRSCASARGHAGGRRGQGGGR